jgi:hypothetical protein
MASGGARVVCGSVVGTGAAMDVETVGFRPRSVKLINSANPASMEWNEAMPDDSAFQLYENTKVSSVFIAAKGITPLDDGFTVEGDADTTNHVNVSGETIYWEAHE